MRLNLLALISVLPFAPAAWADRLDPTHPCHAAVIEARALTLAPAMFPVITVDRRASLVHDCEIISLYFHYRRPAAPEGPRVDYFLRRATLIRGESDAIRWADSRNCPDVVATLEKLQALQPQSIDIPGRRPTGGALRIPVDGDSFRFWSNNGLEFSARNWEPLANWMRETLAATSTCWSESQPVFP